MEDQELRQKLDALEKRIGETYASSEKTRKYLLTVVIISVVAFVLPLVGLVFAVPSFFSAYSSMSSIQ